MDKPLPTTERLALALEAEGCSPWMIYRARRGVYDDYKSNLTAPIGQLVADLRAEGKKELAERAMRGEFDATREEAQAWVNSPEGQDALREFGRPTR